MRCDSLTGRSVSTVVGGLVGCHRGPQIVTSIVFDGETRSITTTDVACTKQLNGGLVIVVRDTPTRTVRVQLTQQGQLVVQKAGLRITTWPDSWRTPERSPRPRSTTPSPSAGACRRLRGNRSGTPSRSRPPAPDIRMRRRPWSTPPEEHRDTQMLTNIFTARSGCPPLTVRSQSA